ncbi:MAG: heme exporter protein CcmB [Flavisolibacter sp.]|jgi:heme exporter protein B|nr:heme exporter protein CcmB [Flavisolibacter sp.]
MKELSLYFRKNLVIYSISRIWTLFKKDLLLEVRQQYAFYGIILYVGATVFVLFMALETPESRVWNGLFWIIQLFISINAVAKSFLQEGRGRMLYYYSIASPQEFILSKLLFNSLLMLVMSLISFILFAIFLGYPVVRSGQFIGIVFLGSWCLSLVFSVLAAIAAKAQQNAAIMAILGFPILIPQLLVLMKISGTMFSMSVAVPLANVLLLVISCVLVILLAIILFPFLWKD